MLDKIIDNKKKEVECSKKNFPLYGFKNKLESSSRDFREALSRGKLNLIAEIKRRSPSQKRAFNKFNIKNTIKIYNKYADAISVLTDAKYFDGCLGDLRLASKLTKLPLLRKDFIIDEYQIYESRLYNANAILLIASLLSPHQIKNFIEIAVRYNMDCIVEVSNENGLKKALSSGADIIGINNRNLDTLEIDTGTTLRLAGKIPKDKIIVSESGIASKDYISKIKNQVNAVLIGTLFMESKNIEKEILSIIK